LALVTDAKESSVNKTTSANSFCRPRLLTQMNPRRLMITREALLKPLKLNLNSFGDNKY